MFLLFLILTCLLVSSTSSFTVVLHFPLATPAFSHPTLVIKIVDKIACRVVYKG